MLRVVCALLPLLATGIYFFGWRALAVVAVSYAAGITTEYLMARQRGTPVSMACFVTCMLYGLAMPPTVPFWVVVVGIVVAILFGKEVFGGFGRNFANPAIVGRAFVYVAFPVPLTAQFVPAFRGFPGGLAHWSFRSLEHVPEYVAAGAREAADAVTQASPMWVSQQYGFDAVRNTGQGASLWNMLLGNIGGTYQAPGGEASVLAAGSIGEGCAVLILLAAVYLIWTKTANWRLMLSAAVGLAAATGLFRHLLGFDGVGEVPPLLFTLLAGTTLYATVFMVTDPVSAPKRKQAQYAYGFVIGFLIVFLRWKGVFVAAASFSILLGNLVGPLLDIGAAEYANWSRARRKAAAEAVSGGGEGGEA